MAFPLESWVVMNLLTGGSGLASENILMRSVLLICNYVGCFVVFENFDLLLACLLARLMVMIILIGGETLVPLYSYLAP
jgi:hypothetical protein